MKTNRIRVFGLWAPSCVGLALTVACSQQAAPATPDANAGPNPLEAGLFDGSGDEGVPPDAGIGDSDAGTPDAGGGPDAGSDADAAGDAGLPWGTPISAPPNVWTWVGFPDSSCNDGTPVGIGINPSTTSSNVLLYFNGGGACWDYFTCYIANSATLGPYGPTQMTSDVASIGNTTNRADPLNPFRDWNYVFIPYCTGDVHAGDNIATYTFGTQSNTFHHKGHANVMAYLARLGPTFPSPAKVMVVGDSAGGAGAAVNYTSARAYWPNATMYMIDDSLPFFPPSETPTATMSSELTNWNIQPVLEGACGSACVTDFSLLYAALRNRFPSDRMAYLGYEQDGTMSAYYETLGVVFQTYLSQLDAQAFEPADVKTFFMNGTAHTMLWSWSTINTTQSVNLRSWVNAMVTDDPQWASAGP